MIIYYKYVCVLSDFAFNFTLTLWRWVRRSVFHFSHSSYVQIMSMFIVHTHIQLKRSICFIFACTNTYKTKSASPSIATTTTTARRSCCWELVHILFCFSFSFFYFFFYFFIFGYLHSSSFVHFRSMCAFGVCMV